MSTAEPIRKLGRYELLKRIAKGGMGEIYLARTRGVKGFEKNCIIKTILPHLAEEEEFVTKFLDEGRIVVQLVHGNIVPVFDMGDEAGEIFMAMEYIPGRDLREVTKRLAPPNKLMPVDLAIFVVSEVCKGLDYAHRKTDESGKSLGIVHRDVSPSNVLISREGEIKLIDFGIARASGREGKTVSGRIQGKFCYMSPEQAAGKSLDGRSDIFSAGLVLYELLTGFRPFEGGTDLESLDLVRQCEFDPPGALNAEVPDEIDAIVTAALQKEPGERYPTIDKFQIALLQYLYSTGSSPTPSDLATWLGDLFPEGLEREELKSARDNSGSPAKKMSLDEALDFELGRLDSGSATREVDPHETTAVSSAELDLQRSTATKSPVVVTPAETRGTDSHVEPIVEPPPRSKLPVVAGIALLLLALAGAAYAFTASTKAKRTITSEPPGASISVDGLLIPGARTPYKLTLEEGAHEIKLELDGYESRSIAVSAEAGTTETVPTTVLRAHVMEKGPQQIRLLSGAEGVRFIHNGAPLASGVVTLTDGEVVTIRAEAEGCRPMGKQIMYGMANDAINFDLDCSGSGAPDAGAPVAEAVEKTITIKSRPAGAQITVDGKKLGKAPVTWTGLSDQTVRIHAQHGELDVSQKVRVAAVRGDSVTMRLAAKPGPPGCLVMSIINPFQATWYLDGKLLGTEKGYKRTVASGSHKVRVVNETNKIDYTKAVTVPPGSKCATLKLDGSTLKPK